MMIGINIKTTSKVTPQCYAYTTPGVPSHDGWTKLGYTERDVETRIKEQTHTVNVEYKTWWSMRSFFMTEPYESFKDTDYHAYLMKLGVMREKDTEWFKIDPNKARNLFIEFAQNHGIIADSYSDVVIPYKLRDEQVTAVRKTADYFKARNSAEYLWNAKPRFGKTLSAYDLCMKLKAQNILIVTNRPAIANSWYSDYATFMGPQSGYVFVSNVDGIKGEKYVFSRDQYLSKQDEHTKGCIEFVSLQDLKGSIYFGGRFDKLSEVSAEKGITWDLLIVDEAHEGVDTYKTDTAFNHIRRKWTLHLSGTPFKALANDKFPENAIYNWTYADEQKKKLEWDSSREEENPYEILPKLSLLTYQMSDIVRDKVNKGIELADNDIEEFAFDLNEFFITNESGKFIHDLEVDHFLDSLTRQEKFPFSTLELRDELKHSFWILNRVASAKALARKLKIHPIFKDYFVVLAAGDGRLDDVDENQKSFEKVKKAISEHDKTITLSVGQLTTGITIPEWTAVLMLCNMSSPSLYMQAAFRAQNPCLFTYSNGDSCRKQNAYVFDFDPARTLTIYEQFANDLIPETSGEKGDFDNRKKNVRKLLNFFPIYGEDEDGRMIELDAEKVLTIPRHIHAREVVERGFMSNFLFANVSGIFGAPKEIINVINNLPTIEEPKNLPSVNDDPAKGLYLNENGEVEIPHEQIIGTACDIFGGKVYETVVNQLNEIVDNIQKEIESKPNSRKDVLKTLREQFSKPISDTLIGSAKARYGSDLRKSAQKHLERKIQESTDTVVNREYGDYTIQANQLEKERKDKIKKAQELGAEMTEITKIDEEYDTKRLQGFHDMVENINKKIQSEETVKKVAETIVEVVETEKIKADKISIEGNIRDHLRGFSRTIPAFLMAYGNKNTTLSNFDTLVPEDVFWEVTVNPKNGHGVTLEQFRMLRDGGDYTTEDGELKHFDGHLFDEVVFNDAVQEFMNKRIELSNYFEDDQEEDIFDYIPPQRTNLIFTPKKIVKDMVDRLEKEKPGCFDNPDATFADLYMKSGMYITEIVSRLYQSNAMKIRFPNDAERLNHIFANQVYGCAPTEIIYRICLRYILGFSDKIHIEKNNIRLCDTLELAKNNNMEEELKKLFGK